MAVFCPHANNLKKNTRLHSVWYKAGPSNKSGRTLEKPENRIWEWQSVVVKLFNEKDNNANLFYRPSVTTIIWKNIVNSIINLNSNTDAGCNIVMNKSQSTHFYSMEREEVDIEFFYCMRRVTIGGWKTFNSVNRPEISEDGGQQWL